MKLVKTVDGSFLWWDMGLLTIFFAQYKDEMSNQIFNFRDGRGKKLAKSEKEDQ